MRLLIIVFCLSFIACQVDESDNYSIYKPDPSTEPFTWPVYGTWHNADQQLVITELELSCETEMANMVYLGQKYFQLDQQVCGLSYSVPWTCYAPHDVLKLWVSGAYLSYNRQ